MSNAMRTGKRWLAGVAAGALGAGLLVGLAASPANAANVTLTSAALNYPSMTLVASGQTGNSILLPMTLIDDAGDVVGTGDTLTGQRLQVTVTAPSTASATTVLKAKFSGGTAGINVESASTTAILGLTLEPFDDTGGTLGTWGGLITDGNAGRYVVTTRLFSTATGSTISTSTMNVDIVSNTAAPAANIAYISGPALGGSTVSATSKVNVLNSLGSTATVANQGTTTASDGFALWITNSTGGPYVVDDDSVAVTSTLSTTTATWTPSTSNGGWAAAASSLDLRVYPVGAANNAWPIAGNTSITSSVTPVSTVVGSGTLPVSVAGVAANGTAATAILNTEPAYFVSSTDSSGNITEVYEVPVGTNSFNFTVLTSGSYTDDTTFQWDAWSSANLGAATPSGGVIPLKADTGSLTVGVNAAASAVDKNATIVLGPRTGGKTTTVELRFRAPRPILSTSQGIATSGTAAIIPGTIQTQFGAALAGTWVINMLAPGVTSCSATPVATATANAAGEFTITAPATFAPTGNGQQTYRLCANNGLLSTAVTDDATVNYTTTGGVSLLTLAASPSISSVTTTARPLIKTPANGTAAIEQTTKVWDGVSTLTAATIRDASASLELAATVNPETTVIFSGTEGVLFTDRTAGSVFYQDATAELVFPGYAMTASGGNYVAPVGVIATKPGLHTVTVRAGTSTATYTFHAKVPSNAARTLTLEPTSTVMNPNSFKTFSATVKDIFGNPVPSYDSLGLALAGGGSLAGNIVVAPETNASGVTQFTYSAPAGTGDAQIVATGSTSGTNAWVTGAIPGAPDSVRTGSINIKVTTGPDPEDKTIVIVGERGTVSGKPGIIVEGDTNGFEDGAKMKPWIRFPGQTEYTVGTARPTVSAAGDFDWQRKTGKKTYVYFTNEAGDVRSNRIIIAAN